jgi:hypothetical protein
MYCLVAVVTTTGYPVDLQGPVMSGDARTGSSQRGTTRLRRGVLAGVAVALLTGRASAHSGSLGGAATSATVPTWLTVLTGGIVVGASFLFTSLLTDHQAMRSVNWWRAVVPVPVWGRRVGRWVTGVVSVGVLGLVVVTGLVGPETPTRNFALLFVWAAWWAGYTITTYLAGNTWPAVNPWRVLARAVRVGFERVAGGVARARVPERYGVWPAVGGLLALVFLEVVSPVGESSTTLAMVVVGYSLVAVAGAVRYECWFDTVDPVSRVFAAYGRVAPIQRDEDGLSLRLPGTALTDEPLSDRPGEAAFVVALLWATTYDGLVATPTWAGAIEPLVKAGVPALLVYVVALLAGFALFLGVYRLAAGRMRERADTYVAAAEIERWFAPALLPIAAGYHLAHFLGYFLSLSPALAAVAASPIAPPAGTVALVLPDWFSTFRLLSVLGGHVLAVWVAHSLAFELFPGVLAAIRSQYPSVVVMIFYTMTSLWVITQPYNPPPFV